MSALRRLKELEPGNNKRKRIVANLMLENEVIKEVFKKALRPSERRANNDCLASIHIFSQSLLNSQQTVL